MFTEVFTEQFPYVANTARASVGSMAATAWDADTTFESASTRPRLRLLVVLLGHQRNWDLTWQRQHLLIRTLADDWTSIGCFPAETSSNYTEAPAAALRLHQTHAQDVRCSRGMVISGCFLRRLSACRPNVLEAISTFGATHVLALRPDLYFPSPAQAGRAMREQARGAWRGAGLHSVLARHRCVGTGSQQRSFAFPTSMCNQLLPENNTHPPRIPCPPGRSTLDDHMALLPAQLTRQYFSISYPMQSGPWETKHACPATWNWPEGRLTEQVGASAGELRGVATILLRDRADFADPNNADFSSHLDGGET